MFPRMDGDLEEAYEFVDDGMLDHNDFREFTFTNPVMLHAGMNASSFEGTVISDDLEKRLAAQTPNLANDWLRIAILLSNRC